jgi:hypothetical protein
VSWCPTYSFSCPTCNSPNTPPPCRRAPSPQPAPAPAPPKPAKRPAFPPSRRAVCRVPGAGVIVAPRTCTTDALETAAVGRTDTAESPPCMASGTTVPFQHSGSPFQLTPYCHTYAASHYVTFRREAFIYGEGLLLTWRFSFKLQAAAGSRPPPPSPVVVTDRLVFCCLL